MYGRFTYIWLIFMVNVGKYTIHGSYGGNRISELNSFISREKVEIGLLRYDFLRWFHMREKALDI